MTMATYASPSTRTGRAKRNILKHAIGVQALEITGDVYRQPVNAGDTVDFRQVVPYGATAAAPNNMTVTVASHLIQEGVTPPVDSLVTLDMSVTVHKYGALYGYTEKQATLGENDIPQWMEQTLGERLGMVREQVYIGALQGCTNVFYSGGTTRLTTDEVVTVKLLERVLRNLRANHAKPVSEVVTSSQNYGTASVQRAYIFFGHTDMQKDIEDLPGYTKIADYGSMKPLHECEVGAWGQIRFVLYPEMPKVADAGAAIAGTTNYSTTGTSADIYQAFIVAKDAWGHCAFRGIDAFKYSHIPHTQRDKSDPTGERGYVSGTFYDCGLVTNHGWMAKVECCITSLT